MKKFFNLMLAASMAIGFAGCSSSAPSNSGSSNDNKPSEPAGDTVASQQLTIGTASSGGAFYVIGTGLAEVITKNVEPLNVTAEITGGSAENVRLVGQGDSDMGISNANDVYFGYTGTETFKDSKFENLTAICALHSSVLHIVTTEKSGVTSIEDLKGKKVAVGPAGGGSLYAFRIVLEQYGLNFENDITPSYLSYDDGIEQLKDGQVDCALVMAGRNASSVQSLQATGKVVLLDVSEEALNAIHEQCPFYYGSTIKSSIYDTDHDASVVAVDNLLYCSDSLDDATVYAITKAICDNIEDVKGYHAALANLKVENMKETSGVPQHPGAAKYFEEISK